MNFQEVVHSAPTVNADVAKHTVIRRGTEWTLTRASEPGAGHSIFPILDVLTQRRGATLTHNAL